MEGISEKGELKRERKKSLSGNQANRKWISGVRFSASIHDIKQMAVRLSSM
jgi:hypothetical protein